MLSGAVLGASAASLAAPTPRVRLVYEGLDGCSSEGELREAVAVRLGYEPFGAEAQRQVKATVRRAGRALVGRLELRDGRGQVMGSRELRAASGDCAELASTMAIALSLAIDPLSAGRPAASASAVPSASSAAPTASSAAPAVSSVAPAASPAAASAVAPAVPASAPQASPPASSEAPPSRVSLRLGLGALAALGAAPGPTLGPTAQVGVRWRSASLNAEGRADVATAASSEHGGAESSLLLASVAPCGHLGVAVGCVLGSFGVLRGKGRDVGVVRNQTASYVAAGARLGAEVPLSETFWLRAHVDAMAPLKPIALTIDGVAVWTTPTFWAGLGLGLGMTF